MRTTLSIADDVLSAVQKIARREKRTAGEVLSELARQALCRTESHDAGAITMPYGFEPFPHRGPAISNELIDRLREVESQ